MEAAAGELRRLGCLPFAGFVTDPCDGRTQGTVGMMDSLPYRNDAAQVFRRLIRSLPTRRGVLGVATCDKGLPAMMMALAAMRDLPCVLVPGGVTLPARERRGRRQGAVDRRAVRPRRDHARAGRRDGLPRVRLGGRRLPVPRHRGDVPGGRRGARARAAPLGARAVRPADLAGHGAALGAGAGRPPGPRARHPRHPDRRARSATPWWSTPRSADRRTCSSTSRRSPTPPASAGRPSTTGST